jgi:NAD-dependent dihydropyrimidine dehydrogenase PreA subunit
MAVSINTDECISCGNCEETCPNDVITVPDKAELTNIDECVECGACVDACPVDAISL